MNYPISGVYEHYKSSPEARKYYQVLGCAKHTETGEVLVVYVPLYVIPEHRGLRLQVRPVGMFLETVEKNGQHVPRFAYIGAEL
jgi:hypothetical protein